MEGVYGWLMQEVVAQATALIWLDMPVAACLSNIRQRGLRRGGDDAALAELLHWASEYRERQSNSSFSGHLRVFQQCTALHRVVLHSREDIDDFMAGISVVAG